MQSYPNAFYWSLAWMCEILGMKSEWDTLRRLHLLLLPLFRKRACTIKQCKFLTNEKSPVLQAPDLVHWTVPNGEFLKGKWNNPCTKFRPWLLWLKNARTSPQMVPGSGVKLESKSTLWLRAEFKGCLANKDSSLCFTCFFQYSVFSNSANISLFFHFSLFSPSLMSDLLVMERLLSYNRASLLLAS